MIVEMALLVIVLLAAIVAYRALKKLWPLIWSSICALVLLIVLNLFGINIAINIFSVLIIAIGGMIGLFLVVLLHLLGIAF
jgi:hypothetical protein